MWTDSVHLTESSYYLHGFFSFDSRSDIIIAKKFIVLAHWEYLLRFYNTLSIVPLILFTLTDVKVLTKKRKDRT